MSCVEAYDMDKNLVAGAIDWTPSFSTPLLPTDIELDRWCAEAVERRIGQLFVPVLFVRKAKEKLIGSQVRIFCPLEYVLLGQGTWTAKLVQLPELISLGVDEVDTLMNLYAFGRGSYQEVEFELRSLVSYARALKPDLIIKVIIETGLWIDDQIRTAAKLVLQSGADYVKTCTGRGPRGVNEQDIDLIRQAIGDQVKIKASGGISTGAQAIRLLDLGASRLGVSSALKVLDSI